MALFLRGGPRSRVRISALVLTFLVVFVVYRWREAGAPSRTVPLAPASSDSLTSSSSSSPPSSSPSAHLVVASLKGDDTAWLHEHLPHLSKSIYIADDPSAALTVPVNKGRESMVYLTYLLDHYDALPDIIIFIHSLRYQWHNDDPLYDGVPMLRSLRLDSVRDQGYANLRCAHTLGCPAEITPLPVNSSAPRDPKDKTDRGKTEMVFAAAFGELFPQGILRDRLGEEHAGEEEGLKVPEKIGVGCCAQFAVSRERVRENKREVYERWQEWILRTELTDAVGGAGVGVFLA